MFESPPTSPFPPPTPVLGCPLDALRVNPDLAFGDGFLVFLNGLLCEADDVLSSVVLHQVQVLES